MNRPAADAAMPPTPISPRVRAVHPLPPRRSFLARYWLLLLFLLMLAAGGGAYYYMAYGTVASAEVALVKRGTALAGVYGTVDVEPVTQVIVRTRNFGLISSIRIKEGDTVKNGEVLADLTDDSLDRSLQAADAALADARMRQTLGPASTAALKNQEIEVEKLKKLLDANNIADVEYEKAQNELTQLREQNQNELLSLNNEVDSLARARDGIQEQVNEMRLTAPMDGVVLTLYANLGEFVPPETQFCRIGSAENEVVANVNEEDVGYLQPGMKARIRLYAHQNEDLIATLKKILPQAENQVYRVRFDLDNPPVTLLPGMTGEMNVIIGQHENALTIPSRAVRKGNIVFCVVDGRVQIRTVTVGFHTLERTEILSGLTEGMAVILSNQDLYSPNVRVRELITEEN
jgi:macrolide-specific efflux system membrane fusion protein